MKPEGLPPTSSALLYHSYWVYYQVADCLGRFDVYAEKWGWPKSKDILLLGTMDKKLLLIYCWRRLVIIAQLTIPCYDVDAEKVVTIIAAYVVSVKWMDARETTQYSSGNQAENRRIQFRHEHIRLPKIQRLINIFL